MEALVVSSCPMAMFISLCNQSNSYGRAPGSALGWVSDCGGEAMLATVRIFDTGSGDGEWLIGTKMWMSSGMAAYGSTCEEVAIGSGMAEFAPSNLSGSSTLMGGGVPKAADGSFFLGVLCWETGIEVVGQVCCSCSKAPWTWRLRVLARVGWGLKVEFGDGARVMLIAPGFMLHKFTSIMAGSWAASPTVAASQSGSSSKSNTKASTPTFSPPWQTTHSLHCSNLHACNWWRNNKGSSRVHLPSGCWGVPWWIVACAVQHHSSGWRHMASPGLCLSVKPGIGPPLPEIPGVLGECAPTWPLGQRSSCTWQLD